MAERDLTRHWALKDIAVSITNELESELDIEWGFVAGEPRPDVTMIRVWEVLEEAGPQLSLQQIAERVVQAMAVDLNGGWGDVTSQANRRIALALVLRHVKAARRQQLL